MFESTFYPHYTPSTMPGIVSSSNKYMVKEQIMVSGVIFVLVAFSSSHNGGTIHGLSSKAQSLASMALGDVSGND